METELLLDKVNQERRLLKVFKPGDKVTIEETPCVLDVMDWECNSPPLGFLWARRLGDISPFAEVKIEGPREVIGFIGIVGGQFYPMTRATEVLVNVPDLVTLKVLYDEYFPAPPTLLQRMLKFLCFWQKKS